MARRLIDRNRAREQQRQSLLLDKLTSRFRGRLRREIADAMRNMVERWLLTNEVTMPRGYDDKIASAYQAMTLASITEFSKRVTGQSKDVNLHLERKLSFAETMSAWALDYVRSEMVRRRITSIAETTRQQVVNAVSRGYADGLGQREVAKYILGLVPQFSNYRANMIARTETHGAANYGAGRAARETNLPLNREWIASGDERTRETHAEADGQIVGMDEPFTVGGASLMYPGDPAGPAEEVINCFPPDALIVSAGLKGGIRRHYFGDLVQISFGGPVDFTVTPNHPVLTKRGWVAAGQIVKGDDLIYSGFGNGGEVRAGSEIDNGYATAQQLYDAGDCSGSVGGPSGVVMDFHGEMVAEKVDVVTFHGSLRHRFKALGNQLFGKLNLANADVIEGRFLADRMINLSWPVASHFAGSLMGGGGSGEPLGIGSHSGGSFIPLRDIRPSDSKLIEDGIYHRPGDADVLGNAVNGVPIGEHGVDDLMVGFPDNSPSFGGVSFEVRKCTSVKSFHYDGPVFNFESDTNLLLSSGIVNHNCRCSVGFIVDESRLFD